MTVLDLSLAVISFVSFGLSIWTGIRKKIQTTREEANVGLTKERLRNLTHSLHSALQTTNAIVQIPKQRQVSADELQDLARIVRAQLIVALEGLEKQNQRLEQWKFGVLLKSDDWPREPAKEQPQSVSPEVPVAPV